MSDSEKTKRTERVTIKDVAKAAGVSIATVSYVLNNKQGQSISDETRKKVLQFANILGYECNIMAKYLATGKTNAIAAVVKDIKPFASQYYLKLLTELSRFLKHRNYDLKLVDYVDAMQRVDCDAFVTLSLTAEEFLKFADTKYVPVVAIDSVFDDFLFYRITDNYATLRSSVDGSGRVELLTYELPPEVIAEAEAEFDGVRVIRELNDLTDLDGDTRYVTVSSSIYGNAVKITDKVKLENASFALKASAAAEAAMHAIERLKSNSDEHIIKV